MPLVLASRDVVEKVDEAFYWIGGIALFFIVGIMLAMLYFIWRYHRSRHPKAAVIEGNTKLEITWIVIPTLIVLAMFWKGYEGFALMRRPPENARVIEVEAYKWYWVFRYPETGVTASDALRVPVNTPIQALLRAPTEAGSPNVIHSFYLPDFRVKEDCVPGRTNTMWFEADETGDYNIFCAEYCGTGHADMFSKLRVMSQEDFDAWMAAQVALRNKPVTVDEAMDAIAIEKILDPNRALDATGWAEADALYRTSCRSCHGEGGEGGLVAGSRDFRSVSDWKNGPKVTEIYKTLEEGIAGTQMKSYTNLTPWQRLALAHKVKRFRQGQGWPEASREDYEAMLKTYELDKERPARLTDDEWRQKRDEAKRRTAGE